ncbi:hypothetical protein NW762_013727 [Fusarium torreyae]|uniref:Uncharacterized protein n=1 Tax=Fusarium torreyae TaxID=1237075 RepID=A0A9W8V758_9HYPO|nr:hypothetical protein NW762_013727 [Fusarium torreyae]
MALCLQLGHSTLVLLNHFCCKCIVEEWQDVQLEDLKQSLARYRESNSDPTRTTAFLEQDKRLESAGTQDMHEDIEEEVTWDPQKGKWIFYSHAPDSSARVPESVLTKGDMP